MKMRKVTFQRYKNATNNRIEWYPVNKVAQEYVSYTGESYLERKHLKAIKHTYKPYEWRDGKLLAIQV